MLQILVRKLASPARCQQLLCRRQFLRRFLWCLLQLCRRQLCKFRPPLCRRQIHCRFHLCLLHLCRRQLRKFQWCRLQLFCRTQSRKFHWFQLQERWAAQLLARWQAVTLQPCLSTRSARKSKSNLVRLRAAWQRAKAKSQLQPEPTFSRKRLRIPLQLQQTLEVVPLCPAAKG